uniref:Uncharacterized protein n=1 Tax=Arundo donax TaxID=35708 RepID=A0A0A8ZLK1_ARUDO
MNMLEFTCGMLYFILWTMLASIFCGLVKIIMKKQFSCCYDCVKLIRIA